MKFESSSMPGLTFVYLGMSTNPEGRVRVIGHQDDGRPCFFYLDEVTFIVEEEKLSAQTTAKQRLKK